MQSRDALEDYKRNQDATTRFPGEWRTTSGRFSGRNGRLVHVGEDGSLCEFSYSLVGLSGIVRSRLGVRPADDADAQTAWFDATASEQTYYGETALVITVHDTPWGPVTQFDLTLADSHVTHIDAGEATTSLGVVACVGFAPDGRDKRIAQLHHEDVVEVYHAEETDYIASATGFESVRGESFVGFETLLSSAAIDYPRERPENPYDEDLLSGDVITVAPTDGGTTTISTLLTTRSAESRQDALERVRSVGSIHDADVLRHSATDQVETSIDDSVPYAGAIAADLRVLSMLTGETGLRIAGPDFDHYYANSGGYGYAWFRDDSEISRFLKAADDHFALGLADWHDRSVAAYSDTQLDDGSWPHRVWPFDGSLAPGWANARLEAGNGVNYQADQTGSVAAFLAIADASEDNVIERALDALDASLAEDGRPVTCQNAWEDMTGRFTHTAATFLEAYATLAANGPETITEHAGERAAEVYDALDDLWVAERGCYALREYADDHGESGLDPRADSATLALANAHRAYAEIGQLDEQRIERLVSHVTTVIDELTHQTDAVTGLVRYEGDDWRTREQDHEKIWTVSTAWGAHAAAALAALLIDRNDPRANEMAETARKLLGLVLPDGPLCQPTGYLSEQVFDDGTPDSATPLGWPHALRLATITLMDKHELLETRSVAADD